MTADFFERQEVARRRTHWLVALFATAVVLTIAAIYALLSLIFLNHTGVETGFDPVALWNPRLFAGVTGGTLAIVAGGTLYKITAMRRGGPAVAEMLGGQLIASNTRDLGERRLLNIVEEMALASGMGVPPVYSLPDEPAINAFAAGFSPNDAVIGVTRGCVQKLTRDELQGVVAHEFSHILNGDMRLNLRLIGVIFGLVCLTVLGRVLLRSGDGGHRKRNGLQLVGLVLIVAGSIGVFFGRLIQAAVSRQREFLADAAAVQFTRNPSGIAGALKKIGGIHQGARLAAPHASEAGHLFFGNALSNSLFGWMSTHPPLADRIRAIEPDFDGKFPAVKADSSAPDSTESSIAELLGRQTTPAPATGFGAFGKIGVVAAVASIGNPTPVHLALAREWQATLEPGLKEAMRDPHTAPAVVWATLISKDDATATRQLDILRTRFGESEAERVSQFVTWVRKPGEAGRLPLIELCLSALRQMNSAQYEGFSFATRHLIEADAEMDLFEFALEKCLERHLAPSFEVRPRERIEVFALAALKTELGHLLALAARLGHSDPEKQQSALKSGLHSLGIEMDSDQMLIATSVGLAEADAALNEMSKAGPALKRKIINAIALTVAHDGFLEPREAELLRAVADVLNCPIPPFVELYRELG